MVLTSPIPVERIEKTILAIRGQKVMLDADLAALFGVTTKALNQAAKQNADRFPDEFMFRLTGGEKSEVVTNCDHLASLKFSRTNPLAFTEHGVLMAANVRSSQRAVDMGVAVVRACVRLRAILASNAQLARKLAELERRYDAQFKSVFDAIRQWMAVPSEPSKPRIGYDTEGQRRPVTSNRSGKRQAKRIE